MLKNKKVRRFVALFFLIEFCATVFFPSVSLALTSGPTQPEFSSFEPVTMTNMVDEFSGDFTYNLPVLEVPGPQGSSYPISLSYHSGVTPEEESSWVGYGWTLNAGAINRNKRGLPDDFNGEQKLDFYNDMPKNWTATVGAGFSFGEVFGVDLKGIVGGSVNGSIRYNNYRGFGYNAGAGISLGRGLVSMGYNVSDGTGSFSLNTNPYAILSWNLEGATKSQKVIGGWKNVNLKQAEKIAAKKGLNNLPGGNLNLIGSTYGVFSYNEVSKPNIVTPYKGQSFNVSVGVEVNAGPVPIGGTLNVYGSYTYQKNQSQPGVPAYGFMYSSEANASGLMDYYVEQEKDFSPQDVFLGIPVNNADNYIVTGEGIGGGFRMHNKKAGHFGPRSMESKMDIINVAADLGLGWTFGGGADIGKGETSLKVTDWNRDLTKFESPITSTLDEPVFFRFNNDTGGEWGDNHNDKPFQASLSGTNLSLSPSYADYNVGGKRSGRSSYIGYHSNNDMIVGLDNAKPTAAAYSKILAINQHAARGQADRKNLIGELSVVNEAGAQYNYGLPVYNRAESNLNYSVRGAESVVNNFLAYTNSLNGDVKVGEVNSNAYASTYLLTEVLTSDYVDRGIVSGKGEHGASKDDLGGYTRFNYHKVTTDAADWYDWRFPFRGLAYNKNSHSDPLDDLGSFSQGEREIYLLRSIETKTHVAIFRTEVRNDSREAPDQAHQNTSNFGALAQEKLTRIDLYPITAFQMDANGNITNRSEGSPQLTDPVNTKPIKSVIFIHDNSLCRTLPNAVNGVGKLTLKQVYFEYNGIGLARLSPYTFSYAYPDYTTYPDKYKKVGAADTEKENVVSDFTTIAADATAQNPAYSFFLADAWGNYQPNGATRFTALTPWVDQSAKPGSLPGGGVFDPAAWQLKVIKLPSGGEIHVQYEQDDYAFVQDQEAHIMARLKPVPSGGTGQYYLDLTSLSSTGLTAANLTDLKAMIDKRYVGPNGKKMYFRILYSLIGNSIPNLSTCNAEYITGYASVSECTISGGNIYINFSSGQGLPKQVCKDFVKAQRVGKLYDGQNCDPSLGLSDGTDAKAVVLQLKSMASNLLSSSDLCKNISEVNSFLRIPSLFAKKGGGLRVKRLLMSDPGMEGEKVLYGNEYLYKTLDSNSAGEISSGVATNEPSSIREENILTDFIARKGQNSWQKIIAGRDKDKSEGPLGESFLPGASVGYSRVVIKNIHSGKTNTGFSVNEYYTAKDNPALLAHPDRPGTMTTIKVGPKDKKNILTPLYSEVRNKTRLTQGFSFVLNNMHGQPKTTSTYSGKYDLATVKTAPVVSRTTYDYFKPGEKVPTMSSVFDGIAMKNPGREVDLTFAQRKVDENQRDVNVEVDLQVTIIPLLFVVLVIPFPTAIPNFSYVEGELSTHSISKVVGYPAIVKSSTIEYNGIKHTEEMLAFDVNTGKPVAVRASDEFQGGYLTQTIPASWEYKDMSGRWRAQDKRFTGTFTVTAQNQIQMASDGCTLADFTPGDIIRLGGASSNAFYRVQELDYITNRLNVVLEQTATAATGSPAELTIVRSGRTNQLQQNAGSFTLHNEILASARPIQVTQGTRYENSTTNSFVQALKTQTQSLSGTGTFSMAGEFTLLDMSAFAGLLPGCATDLTKATVRNMSYRYSVVDGKLTLDLMAFEVKCSESPLTWTLVKAEGW